MSEYNFSSEQRYAIWEAHKRRCIYCGEHIFSLSEVEIDHILPESLLSHMEELENIKIEYDLKPGFDINNYFNWVPTNKYCNRKKSDMLFSKNRALFFLQIAEEKFHTVIKIQNNLEKRMNKGKIVVSINKAIREGHFSYQDLIFVLNNVNDKKQRFNLLQKLNITGDEVLNSLTVDDTETLLDLSLVPEDNEGLKMVIGTDIDYENPDCLIVFNVRDWREAKDKGYYPLNNLENRKENFFRQISGLIGALEKAKIPEESYINEPRVGVVDLNLLPFDIIPGWLFENMIDEIVDEAMQFKEGSIQDLLDNSLVIIKSVSQDKIQFEYKGMLGIILWELMRADFNDDKKEEILTYCYTYAIGGTFNYGDVLILGRDNFDDLFKIISEV